MKKKKYIMEIIDNHGINKGYYVNNDFKFSTDISKAKSYIRENDIDIMCKWFETESGHSGWKANKKLIEIYQVITIID